MNTYETFLRSKVKLAQSEGIAAGNACTQSYAVGMNRR